MMRRVLLVAGIVGSVAAYPQESATDSTKLFDFEKAQLTDEILSKLDGVFQFDNGDDVKLNGRGADAECRVFPGDSAWPSEDAWAKFGEAVGQGALIKTVPLASPCYNGPLYDAAKCEALTANWTNSFLHMEDPTSMMSPVYQGLTCQVTDDPTQSCTLGALPYYAVNISTVAQVQLAINFARNNKIRLVVKNTGHDFSGKSGGAGSLSIWTHNLKDIEHIPSYSAPGSDYTGPAFKAGVGAQAFEMYEAANKKGLVVVGGEGKTVGVMGGYIQGGGHSPLSSLYGTGADQVLSFEVTTADGKFVTADFTQNTDLFWALRGGGGSTFGVATSVTVKAYPDQQFTASNFSFAVGGNVTLENFWTGVRNYMDYFPSFAAEGIYAYWFILAGETGPTFKMMPFWAPGKTVEETNALLAPWLAQLAALGIQVTPETTNYDNFLSGWEASFPLEVVEKTHVASGSRLWPKENWKTKEALDAMYNEIKASSDAGLIIIAFIIDPAANSVAPDNAVNSAWRNTYSHMIQSVSWPLGATAEFQKETRKNFTFGAMQRWRDVSPGAGSYLAESDILEPDFQQSFYGKAYDRLLKLKKQFDPKDVFYAQTAVGSEFWEVVTADGLPSGNGKLCKVQN
ncbi:hypothetical protein V492_06885 [Pseudogymnoascus sp. VKM F-4246]|nr:hypothetical protein V492_06885 [Pseudogymnoascus sp. VKM F-4246]